MKAVELINFFAEAMKALSKVGIRMEDCSYLTLWREYRDLMEQHHKKTYAVQSAICDYYGIAQGSEEAAYLQGYLTRQAMPIIERICPVCGKS